MLKAGHRSSADSRDALVALCEIYWYPLYAYARRKCSSIEEAQDLTQEFFVRFLEKNDLTSADPDQGRFRWYLLGAFKHFLSNEWKKANAEKRGGRLQMLSLEFETAEQRFSREPIDQLTPERAFEHQWAMTFLERVIELLKDDYARRDKLSLFDQLKPFLMSDQESGQDYEQASAELNMSVGAVKVAATRLRDRFRRRFRAEVEQTVASEDDVQDEGMRLLEALRITS